ADDRSLENVPLLQPGGTLCLSLTAQLLCRGLLGEDEAIAFLVDLEHAQAQPLADERPNGLGYRSLAGVDRADRAALREWDESAHADVDDDTTAVRVDHFGLDDLGGALKLLHSRPLATVSYASQ